MTPIQSVNKKLAKLGREERLVRHPSGYYYMSGVWCSSMLCCFRLDDCENDHQLAIQHVEEVLTENDGEPFKFQANTSTPAEK